MTKKLITTINIMSPTNKKLLRIEITNTEVTVFDKRGKTTTVLTKNIKTGKTT